MLLLVSCFLPVVESASSSRSLHQRLAYGTWHWPGFARWRVPRTEGRDQNARASRSEIKSPTRNTREKDGDKVRLLWLFSIDIEGRTLCANSNGSISTARHGELHTSVASPTVYLGDLGQYGNTQDQKKL